MSNLKKVLALALVVAMMFTLTVSIGAADFKDQSKITYQKQATLLRELEIMKGDTEGNFDPTRNVTRGETAKMIYVALNNGIDDGGVFYKNANTGLTDIVGHWAEGYISYCFQTGIIAGIGGGKFSPNADVTGVQLAKMLLVCLGYLPEVEGYVNNASWELNINVRAQGTGIYEGFTGNPRDAMSRENAALLIYNALFGEMVHYDANINIVQEDQTFAEKKFRLVTINGILVSNEIAALDGAIQDEGKSRIYVKLEGTNNYDYFTYDVVSDTALLGQSVDLYAKLKKTVLIAGAPLSTKCDPDNIDKVFGNIAASPSKNNVKSGHPGQIKDVANNNNLILDAGTEFFFNYQGVGGTTTYIAGDGGSSHTITASFSGAGVTDLHNKLISEFNAATITNMGSKSKISDYGAGNSLRLIDNDNDKKVDYALVEVYGFGEVTAVNHSRKSLTIDKADGIEDAYTAYRPKSATSSAGSTYSDLYIGAENVELDQYVMYLSINEGKTKVWAAPSVSGLVTGYTVGSKVRVTGKDYEISKVSGSKFSSNSSLTATCGVPEYMDNEHIYYIDTVGGARIMYVKEVSSVKRYCVITGVDAGVTGGTGGTLTSNQVFRVAVLFADGTKGTYSVSSINNEKPADGDDYKKQFRNGASASLPAPVNGEYRFEIIGLPYAYSVSGSNITLNVGTNNARTASFIAAGHEQAAAALTIGGYTINNSSVIFTCDNLWASSPKWYAYQGRSASPKVVAGATAIDANILYSNISGLGNTVSAVAYIGGAVKGGMTGNYAVLTDTPGVDKISDDTYQATFRWIRNGAWEEVKSVYNMTVTASERAPAGYADDEFELKDYIADLENVCTAGTVVDVSFSGDLVSGVTVMDLDAGVDFTEDETGFAAGFPVYCEDIIKLQYKPTASSLNNISIGLRSNTKFYMIVDGKTVETGLTSVPRASFVESGHGNVVFPPAKNSNALVGEPNWGGKFNTIVEYRKGEAINVYFVNDVSSKAWDRRKTFNTLGYIGENGLATTLSTAIAAIGGDTITSATEPTDILDWIDSAIAGTAHVTGYSVGAGTISGATPKPTFSASTGAISSRDAADRSLTIPVTVTVKLPNYELYNSGVVNFVITAINTAAQQTAVVNSYDLIADTAAKAANPATGNLFTTTGTIAGLPGTPLVLTATIAGIANGTYTGYYGDIADLAHPSCPMTLVVSGGNTLTITFTTAADITNLVSAYTPGVGGAHGELKFGITHFDPGTGAVALPVTITGSFGHVNEIEALLP